MRNTRTQLLTALLITVTLTGCAPGGQTVAPAPTSSSSSTPTATQVALTPEQTWNTFNEAAANSCQEAYNGLVEEDISGPEVGKLKIRLTFEQAGENSFAYTLPDGTTDLLYYQDYYACELNYFWVTNENVQLNQLGFPEYSANLPLQVTFNPQDSTFTTLQQMPDGTQRNLKYTITNGLISRVENLIDGSVTTLTFGQPSQALTDIVNDFYTQYFSG